MSRCTLTIAGHVVLVTAGQPLVEYALFDPGEIELRATAPGHVRETSYQTNAKRARLRFTSVGLNLALVEKATFAMQPTLATEYARGPLVRRVAGELTVSELFDGGRYDASTHAYRGAWLDLPALARDLAVPSAAASLQALYLASILHEVDDYAELVLSTEELTRDRRPGERTYKRCVLEPALMLPDLLRDLASGKHATATTTVRDAPTRAELLEALRGRLEIVIDPLARERIERIDRAAQIRQRPTKGPLADPGAWEAELRLDARDAMGALDLIDAVEEQNGRTPGTTYLRARASLAIGQEDPTSLAERVASLALATPFDEVELLAAEAWLAAGHPARALPYTRDLLASPSLDDEVQVRALALSARVEAALNAAHAKSVPADPIEDAPKALSPLPRPPLTPLPPQEMPRASDSDGRISKFPRSERQPAAPSRPAFSRRQTPTAPEITTASATAPPPPNHDPIKESAHPSVRTATLAPAHVPANPGGSQAPASMRSSAPPHAHTIPAPSAPSRPAPPVARPSNLPSDPRAEPNSNTSHARASSLPPSEARIKSRRYAPIRDPRAESEGTPLRKGSLEDNAERDSAPRIARARNADAPPFSERASLDDAEVLAIDSIRPRSSPPAPVPRFFTTPPSGSRISSPPANPYMRGASQPPFRAEALPPDLPKSPLLPRTNPDLVESAEMLSMPAGLDESDAAVGDSNPSTIVEARIYFTLLSRDLGRFYRAERGCDLTSDLAGIEAMQVYLREAFPDHAIKTPEQALDARRHGAFLSEILARSLGAEWVDISPSELGRWSMVLRPSTRLWPFGRVRRFVQMGHKERDLVSYYLELQGIARKNG